MSPPDDIVKKLPQCPTCGESVGNGYDPRTRVCQWCDWTDEEKHFLRGINFAISHIELRKLPFEVGTEELTIPMFYKDEDWTPDKLRGYEVAHSSTLVHLRAIATQHTTRSNMAALARKSDTHSNAS